MLSLNQTEGVGVIEGIESRGGRMILKVYNKIDIGIGITEYKIPSNFTLNKSAISV